MESLLSLANPVLKSYLFYGSVLGVKMLAMSLLTGKQRFAKGLIMAVREIFFPKMDSLLSLDNPVLKTYLLYCSILGLKMLAMTALTTRLRHANKAFANPEDVKGRPAKVKVDDDVERVRRAHLNDLENIPVFLIASAFYVLTNPAPALALNLFRGFTIARFLHTLVYAVVVIPQPARALSFFVGYAITGYILVQNILAFV